VAQMMFANVRFAGAAIKDVADFEEYQ